jgi:predicted transcriptional regulator
MLYLIRGRKKGVAKEVLLKILLEKSIYQLLYLGLISERDNKYHLTVKGEKVLDACKL